MNKHCLVPIFGFGASWPRAALQELLVPVALLLVLLAETSAMKDPPRFCAESHHSSSCLGSVRGYALNMDQRRDRWDNMIKWWGAVWPDLAISRVQTSRTDVRGLGAGIGHITALEMAAADDVDFALVLEDNAFPFDVSRLDPQFSPNSSWAAVLGNLIAHLPSRSSVLLLGGHHIHPNPKWDTDSRYRAIWRSKGIVQIFRSFGAYAYIVSREQITPLLSLWKQHIEQENPDGYNIDIAWWELWKISPAFLATPLMVDHASGFSHTHSEWAAREWEGVSEWWTIARDDVWSDMFRYSWPDEAYIGASDLTTSSGASEDVVATTTGGFADGRNARSRRKCDLVVLVLSARENFSRRQLLRKNLEGGHKQAEHMQDIFFLVGQPCTVPNPARRHLTCQPSGEAPFWMYERHITLESKVDSRLIRENAEHGDLIFLPTTDVYRNLPKKLKDAYKWALAHHNATWIAKIDDDTLFLDFYSLEQYLCSLGEQERIVVGRIAKHRPVRRDGKWAELNYKRDDESAQYPPFPQGSNGHVVSRDVAAAVTELDAFEYQGEDTSLGIWIDESHLKSEIQWIDSEGFQSRDMFQSVS